jgi:uncharacterized protein YecT (DUF1311 family)
MHNVPRYIILSIYLLASVNTYADFIIGNDVKNCTAQELANIDATLNERYARLMNLLSGQAQQSLKQAQRQWIKYRDSVCDFEKNYLTPDDWYAEDAKGAMRLNCLVRLTKNRVVEFNKYINLRVGAADAPNASQMMDLVYSVLTQWDDTSSPDKLATILGRVEDLAIKIKNQTGKDFTQLTKQHSPKYMFHPYKHVISSHKRLRMDSKGVIDHIDKEFMLVLGDCNIAFASNSIIICTGKVHVSHSTKNIVIANGDVDISHDGSVGKGSIIYSKLSITLSHSNSSVLLFAERIKISHALHTHCINIEPNNKIRTGCNYITDSSINLM